MSQGGWVRYYAVGPTDPLAGQEALVTKRHRYQATMAPETWARLKLVAERTGRTLSGLLECLGIAYLEEVGPLTWTEAEMEARGVTVLFDGDAPQPEDHHHPTTDQQDGGPA